MCRFILCLFLAFDLSIPSQVNYTFSITEMMAEADDCDGEIAGICTLDPQDPVINIWVYDDDGNSKDTCFIYDDNNNMEYGNWYDFQDINFLSASNSSANVIYIDLEGFESDQTSNSCTSDSGDDNILPQINVKLVFLSGLPNGSSYIDIASLGGIYQVKFEILKNVITTDHSLIYQDLDAVIYPNPVNDHCALYINSHIYSMANLKIFNITGEELLSKEFEINEGDNQLNVDMRSISNGIYLAMINYKGKSKILKLVIKH